MAEIKTVKLKDLSPDDKNANLGTDRGRKMLQESLRSLGAGRSILLDKNGKIIVGNKTSAEAAELGMDDVLVVQTDGTKIVAVQRIDLDLETDEKAKRLAIADNRIGQVDLEWDANILQQLKDTEPGILDGMWTEDELAEIISSLNDEPPKEKEENSIEKNIEEREAIRQKYGVEKGQVWSLGDHRIMCGDSTTQDVSTMMGVDKANMVFTDPPYGVNYESDVTGGIENDNHQGDDLVNFLRPAFQNLVDFTTDTAGFYIWHANRREFEWVLNAVGIEEKQYITWVKDSFVLGRNDYHHQTEFCFYCQKSGQKADFYGDRKNSTVWRLSRASKNNTAISIANWLRVTDGQGNEIYLRGKSPKNQKSRIVRLRTGETVLLAYNDNRSDAWEISRDPVTSYIHPNQKPVELAERGILNSSRPGDIVLDLFLGSGSTLIAAERTGRKCRGMEFDPGFFACILDRWHRETGFNPQPYEL